MTWFIAAAGALLGGVVLTLGVHTSADPSEASPAASYELIVGGIAVWAVTAILTAVTRGRRTRRRVVAASVGVAGTVLTAAILCVAVQVAKNPVLTGDQEATADDHAFVIIAFAVAVASVTGLVCSWSLSREAEG